MNRRELLAGMAAAIASPWEAAIAEWPFPRVRPSPSNCDASIEALWRAVASYGSDAGKRLEQGQANEENIFRMGVGAVGVHSMQRFGYIVYLAIDALWQRRPEGPQLLREAFSHLYWAAEILQIRRPPYVRDSLYLDRFWLHGLAAAGGAAEIADWVAPHLFYHFRDTGGKGDTIELAVDVPFQRFFRNLLEAHMSGRWPERIDRRRMRAYGTLMSAVDDPKAFSAALVEFCDYRMLQAFGYDSMDAPWPRSGDRSGSVLDTAWWPRLYPPELFSLRHVYQKTTGRSLSLEAEHPLLKTPLMNVPPLLPLHENDFIRRARALAQAEFGSAWRPLTHPR